jgi:hypothetical protein
VSRLPRWLRISVLAVILVALVGLGLLYFTLPKDTEPPKNLRDSIAFALYWPQKMPPGFHVDRSSIHTTSQVVTFEVRSKNEVINVSEQARPAHFDFEEFNTKKLFGTTDSLTPAGKLTVGLAGNRSIGSLVTDKTWILAAAQSDQAAQPVKKLLTEFREVAP